MRESMESDDPRDTLWFLAGVVVVGLGAAFLFRTEEGDKVRRQLLLWTQEAQRRLADIQDVLEVTRQLCEGELPGEVPAVSSQRMRVVKGAEAG